jgi:predicted DNA-binding transcriptional regulator AlpA
LWGISFALFPARTGVIDQWLQLSELSKLFGLSEESIERMAKKNGFPLRRLTPYATLGVLESEFLRWLKAQPLVGQPVRSKRPSIRKKMKKG